MEKLKVIFEDNHIIVVEKPVNIPSQGDKTGDIDMISIIKDYLKVLYLIFLKLSFMLHELFTFYIIL